MDLLSFIVVIAILVGIWFAYSALSKIGKSEDKGTKELTVQERINAVRTAIKAPRTTLSATMITTVEKFKQLNMDVDTAYPGWGGTTGDLGKICDEGYKFLDYYLIKQEPVVLKIVDAIATKLVDKLSKITGEVIEKNPWKGGWYQTSITLTHFLASYVYIGTNKDLIAGCKKQLLRLVPEVGLCLGITHSGLELFKVSVPRLCVTYLDPATFKRDTTTDKFREIKEFMNLKHVQVDSVEDGYYDDGSVILQGLASYERFLATFGFYEDAYRGMGLATNIKDLAVNIFPKLTHPDVPWCPLGLFRTNENRSLQKMWPWTYTNTGITLMPFIGLGVFKCPEFMFFVRVQRPDVHAYDAKSPDLAAGCVQIRRIFFKGEDYKLTLTKIRDEPGVLSTTHEILDKMPKAVRYDYSSINSFIGCLDGLMFWKNSYKYNELNAYVIISEAGVITANGLQAHYKIQNYTNETLKFRYLDLKKKLIINEVSNVIVKDGFVEVPIGTKEFTWTMATKQVDYKPKLTDTGMTFNASQSEPYVVELINGFDNQYIAKCGAKTLLGSSSSRTLSEIIYDKKTYRRNPDTMMYQI